MRKYGKYQWFDPGDPASEEIFINVLTDVVKRYDIDGVHIDDYFYPYQEKDKDGKIIPFPDDETYKRAVAAGEKLERDDWRRQNVNHLIERMYDEVKKAKPWVLGRHQPVRNLAARESAGREGLRSVRDALRRRPEVGAGRLARLLDAADLLAGRKQRNSRTPKLLAWWAEQNVKQRHLWPGNFTSKIGVKPTKEDRRS